MLRSGFLNPSDRIAFLTKKVPMDALKMSPLAPAAFPELPDLAGVRLGHAEANIHYHGRDDLMVAVFAPGTRVAGVLTRSVTASAPVLWCRKQLLAGRAARALVVNAGNANAFTGTMGHYHVQQTCAEIAGYLDCSPEEVFVASTGIIGQPLPIDRLVAMLPDAIRCPSGSWAGAARAILTTDTFPKGATRQARVGNQLVTINGFAKGSGMIEPDMATMLAFVFTDAALSREVLQTLLVDANRISFNSITVDSDMSTSDTCLLFASGAAGNPEPDSVRDSSLDDFREALQGVMQELAIQVVRDGEGARKLIEVVVRDAATDQDARTAAKSIANSPLVKTAIAGEDANWGRVVMAVGKSGVRFDQENLGISIGGILIADQGKVMPDYDESRVTAHLQGQEVLVEVTLGEGRENATVWTCDLTHDYVAINADYRS